MDDTEPSNSIRIESNNNNSSINKISPSSQYDIKRSCLPKIFSPNMVDLIEINLGGAATITNTELQHLAELNNISTRLPLYQGMYNNVSISVLIDSGASTNYVSPKLLSCSRIKDIHTIPERHVETADGGTTRIDKTLNMRFHLGNFTDQITAFVFPTKFDLILGRTWLQRCNPKPDWFTDSWTLSLPDGSVTTIRPCNKHLSCQSSIQSANNLAFTDNSHGESENSLGTSGNSFGVSGNSFGISGNSFGISGNSSGVSGNSSGVSGISDLLGDGFLPELQHTTSPINRTLLNTGASLDYVISHKQADRLIRKHNAEFCLMFIKDPNVQDVSDVLFAVDSYSSTKDIPNTYWKDLISEFSDVFQDKLPGLPPARETDEIMIDTGDAKPINRPPYKTSPAEMDELRRQITELLALGLIKPSTSPWGAPVLFVRKKSGELRMCVDYRALNRLCVKKSYGLPNIDESLERLQGSSYFSSLDLKSGYHQLRLKNEDIPKTTMNTRMGKFSWLTAPFGLKNCPFNFMSLMNNVLADCLNRFALVYLDDVLIYSRTAEEHRKHVRHVLELFRKHKLIANLKKCEFGKRELEFLGYKISDSGILPGVAKVKAIREWPRPTNVQEVRQFVGLAQHFRKFCPSFASVVAPLTDLTRGTGPKKRSIHWSPDCERSFDKVKQLLTSAPCLQMPNPTLPYRIECDASDFGAGACLLQPSSTDPSSWHPVAYESKKFSDRERKYPTQERELAAILMALRAWRHLVDGCTAGYTVFTDHLPLKYFRSQDKPTSRLIRWIAELEMYDPDIQYKSGTSNVVPDALSRRDGPSCTPAIQSMEPEYIYAVSTFDNVSPMIREDWPLLYLDNYYSKIKSTSLRNKLTKERANFEISGGKIFRKVELFGNDGISTSRLVPYLPFAKRADVVSQYHESFGHCGYETMVKLLSPRVWWSSMKVDLRNWLRSCPACQVNGRRSNTHKDVMHPLNVPNAFSRWHLDFIGELPTTLKGNRWILMAVDYATNWPIARAVPVASQEAVADFIYEEIVLKFGCPVEILTDRGANFCGGVVNQYTKRLQTEHKLTSAFHPRTNSKVERLNGVFKAMLRKYVNGALHRWDDFINAAIWSCRIRVHSTTGYSPFYLTYGREPRLPGDIMVPYIDNTTANDPRTIADFTSRELAALGQARAAAEARMRAMAKKDKQKWDAVVKKTSFEPGDLVLLTHEGRLGLEPCFKGPYIVVESFPDYGTYKLQTLAGEPLKTLVHVDRLKAAYGDTPSDTWYNPTTARRDWKQASNKISPSKVIASGNTNASPHFKSVGTSEINEFGNRVTITGQDEADPLAENSGSNTVSTKDFSNKGIIITNSKASNPSKAPSLVSNDMLSDKLVPSIDQESNFEDNDSILSEDIKMFSPPPCSPTPESPPPKISLPDSFGGDSFPDKDVIMSNPDSSSLASGVQRRTPSLGGNNVSVGSVSTSDTPLAKPGKRRFKPISPSRKFKKNKLNYIM